MNWKIGNIDDLDKEEKVQLNDFEHYRLFRGLFIISKDDVENWKKEYNFDDWILASFPEGYIDKGRFSEDLDNEYEFITEFILTKNENLYINFIKMIKGEHESKELEDLEDYLKLRFNEWGEKEFSKFDGDREGLYSWISNEICKFIRKK